MRRLATLLLVLVASCARPTPAPATRTCESLLRCNAPTCSCPDGYVCRRVPGPTQAECFRPE